MILCHIESFGTSKCELDQKCKNRYDNISEFFSIVFGVTSCLAGIDRTEENVEIERRPSDTKIIKSVDVHARPKIIIPGKGTKNQLLISTSA